MPTPSPTQVSLVAIVGGSGSGKTWLARRLAEQLHPNAASLALDDFYLDRSRPSQPERNTLNFDHPGAIDWPAFERAIESLRVGRLTRLPVYDFSTHSRRPVGQLLRPPAVVIVDGLWLLHRVRCRRAFAFSMFVDCPERERRRRRLERDQQERGRVPADIREQWSRQVLPMHRRFVAPQRALADRIVHSPVDAKALGQILHTCKALIHPARGSPPFRG